MPQEFDSDPKLLNCNNGTVDLSTGELRHHDRADLLTCLAPVDFDKGAPCQVWENFVYEIQEKNIEVYEFLQRILGYALTGFTREQCLFILWGSGANGKSTLINLVTRLLGKYARNTPVETLLDKKRGGEIPIDVARLDGPRLVTAKEVDRGRRLSESLIKELTGQDTISARFLYGEFFDFIPKFKLFLSTNHMPIIRGTDNAIWRRIKLIRFPVQIPEEEWDQDLPEKLWAEAPGILNWLVEGCLSWQKWGLNVPEAVKESTAEFRGEMDVLADFLAERCIIASDKSGTAKELYQCYKDWAEDQGLSEREILKQRTFGMALSERGFRRHRSTHGRHRWTGLGVLQDNESPGENV
jgi:putative DNA primase/helicase